MEEFDLDIVPLVSPLIRINTPEGTLELRCDMPHVLAWRVVRWLDAYRPFILGLGEGEAPSLDEMFEMAAETTHKPIELMREWGSMACVRLLDFLVRRFFNLLGGAPNLANGTKSPAPPSGSASRRTGRSR